MNCDANNKCDTGEAFNILAKYIGVGSRTAANEGKKSMSMTAPVTITPEKMAMTAPVVQSNQYLGFVLPLEYKEASQAPKPLDQRIQIRTVPEKLVAVESFTWWYTEGRARDNYIELKDKLSQVNLAESTQASTTSGREWISAQYNAPWTIPFLRTNEVWIELNTS